MPFVKRFVPKQVDMAGNICIVQWKASNRPPKDIEEVKNAYEICERMDELNPFDVDDLIKAHCTNPDCWERIYNLINTIIQYFKTKSNEWGQVWSTQKDQTLCIHVLI